MNSQSFQFLYFRRFFSLDLHKQIIKILYINHIMNQILGIKEIIVLTERVWSRGHQCLTRECVVLQPKPTQSSWPIFPGVHILTNQPAHKWPELASAQLSSGHRASTRTFSAIIPGSFNKLTNRTLGSRFTLLVDQKFIHWTPNLAILLGKPFDCFKCLQKTQTPFQNPDMDSFGRWQKWLSRTRSPDF